MAIRKFLISNTLNAPASLDSGAIEYYRDGNGIIYQFVGNVSNQPVMIGTTLQSISQTIIAPIPDDEITLFHSRLGIKITRVLLVLRATNADLNLELCSSSDRSNPIQTIHFSINDFNTSNFPAAATSGYVPVLNTDIVAPNDFLVLRIPSVNQTTAELFIHIDYIYQNP
jgi:hypothetical protein